MDNSDELLMCLIKELGFKVEVYFVHPETGEELDASSGLILYELPYMPIQRQRLIKGNL